MEVQRYLITERTEVFLATKKYPEKHKASMRWRPYAKPAEIRGII
jgi:hypothetical protein